MLILAVILAYHVPLQELIGTHNVVEALEVAEALNISVLRGHCLKLLGEGLEQGNCVGTSWSGAFRLMVRNLEEVWTTSPQFHSLAFEDLWSLLHQDELHVTREFLWSCSQVDRRGPRGQTGSFSSTSSPLEDEKAYEVLNVIQWTLHQEALDSGEWGFWPYLVDRRWLRPRIPKDVLRPNQYMPARANHGVATLDLLIYFIGGFDGTICYQSVVRLNVPELKWAAKSNMHMARCYVIGRRSSCERYDASRNLWELVASMHDRMSGFTGLDGLDFVEYYDPTADVWTLVCSMSRPRNDVKAVVQGDDVYVMGVFDGAYLLDSTEKLNVHTGWWSQVPSMAFAMSNLVAALLERKTYVTGLFNGTTTVSLVERYDVKARQCHRATDLSITCSAAATYVYNIPNAGSWLSVSVYLRAWQRGSEVPQ
ncbi:hypothetical protein HPB48_019256 [Haemaphysalis longicornis]|uniref:Uncharacterized protein n=1 Tax=Haemaphysalis longicornis TaxID=44386 RepID=A0A9J6GPS5_HAELO|nr:hypothetical protein HPB48_019256 [Haemaphysalis longicornis]